MSRELLPNRRNSIGFSLEFQGERYDVTAGFYSDGRIGETFINRVIGKSSAKVGTLLDGICRDAAILVSLCLQHGVGINTIKHAITRDEEGEPATIVGKLIDTIENVEER